MVTLIQSKGALSAGRRSFYNGEWHVKALPEAPVSIGSYCAIGRNFTIMPINHDTRFPAVQGSVYRHYFNRPHPGEVGPPSRQRSKGGVVIGSDVWIADNVTILGGVTIGDGACIGAGSVVTKSVPPFTVAAGVPCRKISPRFPDAIIALLSELRWWDWSEERIRRNEAFFMIDLTSTTPELVKQVLVD